MSASSGIHNARDSTAPPSGSTPKRTGLVGAAAFSVAPAPPGASKSAATTSMSGIAMAASHPTARGSARTRMSGRQVPKDGDLLRIAAFDALQPRLPRLIVDPLRGHGVLLGQLIGELGGRL